jgi:hypothetical protein
MRSLTSRFTRLRPSAAMGRSSGNENRAFKTPYTGHCVTSAPAGQFRFLAPPASSQ